MKLAAVVFFTMSCAGILKSQSEPLKATPRFNWYVQRTYTDPWKYVWLIGEVTADDFAFGEVRRWGSGLSGWGTSLAPAYGRRVINNTAELGLGALIGDDARYHPSEKLGVIRRSFHAAAGAFTARAKDGSLRPAYSRITAITTGALIANRWRPKPEGGGGLAGSLAFGVTDNIYDNLLREFGPDLKRFGRRIFCHNLHRGHP